MVVDFAVRAEWFRLALPDLQDYRQIIPGVQKAGNRNGGKAYKFTVDELKELRKNVLGK